MENNILSKKEIKDLYLRNKLNFSRTLKLQHINTYNFIDKNFNYIKSTNSNNRGKNKFTEKIYQYVFGIYGGCKQCKINPTTFRSFSRGYFNVCSQKCQQLNTASKYGVKNLFQSNIIKEKMKNTWIKNHGIDNPMKLNSIKEKGLVTKEIKYGNKNYNNLEKYKKTMLLRHGVTSPVHMKDWFEKWTKSGVKRKPYTLPSGKIVMIQGYENKALDIMLKKYKESEIFEEIPPVINYIENEIKRKFYPDFYIKKDNLIIEIKSQFTFDKWVKKNIEKMKACKNKGFDIEFWIIGKKGNLENVL